MSKEINEIFSELPSQEVGSRDNPVGKPGMEVGEVVRTAVNIAMSHSSLAFLCFQNVVISLTPQLETQFIEGEENYKEFVEEKVTEVLSNINQELAGKI